MDNYKPIVMICDNNFVRYTCVTLISIKANKKKSTKYEVYVILVDCLKENIELVKSLEEDDFRINIIEHAAIDNKRISQIAHVSQTALLKFNICDLIPQYDKILYLDGDLIIREDISNLFDIELNEKYLACAIHSIAIITGAPKLNSGVMLLNASKIRNEHMSDVFIKTREDLGDRSSMDQETFHIVFNNKLVRLKPRYNVMVDKVTYEKKFYTMKSYNEYFGTEYKKRNDIIKDAAILHYTGAIKPWKYDFAPCADEWKKYYKLMYGNFNELELKGYSNYLKSRRDKEGLKVYYRIAKDHFLEFIGDRFGLFLDKSFKEWK